MEHSTYKKLSAEFIGTFWLTLGGCGSAVLAAAFPNNLGIGFLGVSLAFGLTVVTGAYALGPISGGHFNPAVSIGLAAAGRFKASQLAGYIVSQVLGAIAAAGVLYLIATGKPGADIGGFATNGFGEHSPGKYGMTAALVCEVVMTAVFLIVILGATAKRAAGGFAGLAIGLCLTLIHLISIPVTNTSVNPARSTGPALFGPSYAVSELWLFWVAPIVGAIIGALIYRALLGNNDD
ncbi:aquaporin Z [Variovorax paradoxus]|uniref:Aquaporin Z n=2 Tax=Variovorax paradoxus TaxID=34073 RepID=A0A0H2LTC6_VARPD|nr:aquaporin Z [Variovorax paradoxus]KLN53414.1 aquaporin Z 2 [Variovorax paradoxus]